MSGSRRENVDIQKAFPVLRLVSSTEMRSNVERCLHVPRLTPLIRQYKLARPVFGSTIVSTVSNTYNGFTGVSIAGLCLGFRLVVWAPIRAPGGPSKPPGRLLKVSRRAAGGLKIDNIYLNSVSVLKMCVLYAHFTLS